MSLLYCDSMTKISYSIIFSVSLSQLSSISQVANASTEMTVAPRGQKGASVSPAEDGGPSRASSSEPHCSHLLQMASEGGGAIYFQKDVNTSRKDLCPGNVDSVAVPHSSGS